VPTSYGVASAIHIHTDIGATQGGLGLSTVPCWFARSASSVGRRGLEPRTYGLKVPTLILFGRRLTGSVNGRSYTPGSVLVPAWHPRRGPSRDVALQPWTNTVRGCPLGYRDIGATTEQPRRPSRRTQS
jgi:hypothetical protein